MRRAVSVLVGCAPALATAPAAPAGAQEPDSVEIPLHHMEEVRVTVSRLEAEGVPVARLPFAAHVRRIGELADPGAATAADLLAGMPGISFADQFGSPFQQDLRFRGFQVGPVVGYPQGVSVFVDGVRVNEPDASQVNFDLIPLQAIERVEVIRAPGGPFGRNTLAGAVNLVTRSGGWGSRGALELTAGSFGRRAAEGWAGGGSAAGAHYLVSVRAQRSDGWRDLSEARLAQVFSKVGWRGERTSTWLSYTFADNRLEAPGSLPVTWLAGDLPPELAGTADPRRLQFTGFEGDWFEPRLDFVVAGVRRELGAGPVLDLNGFVRANRFTQFNDNITEPNVRGETDITSGGVTGQLSWSAPSGLVLGGGAEYIRNRVGIRIFAEANEAFPRAGGQTEDVASRDENLAAFAHLWAPLSEHVGVATSLRYDHIDLPITDLLDPENSGENTFSQLSGSVGLDLSPLPAIRVFAGYGRGFRAPVVLELTCADPEDPCPLPFELGADPPLDPVTTDSWQAGARWSPAAAAHLELVGYRAEVHDDLFAVVADPPTRGYFMNLDRTRRQGLEMSGGLSPVRGLAVSGSLALTRATFQSNATLASALIGDGDDEPGGAPIDEDADENDAGVRVEPGDHFAMVPGLSWSAAADYASGPWTMGLDAEFVDEQYFVGDEANEMEHGRLDSRFLVAGSVERRFGGLRIFARGENLLDSDHRTFGLISPNVRGPDEAPQPFLSPGLPRRVTAGIRYAF